MQCNPNAGGKTWDVVKLTGTLSVNTANSTWEYKCDVTNVAVNRYTVHFSTENKENTDFVKPGKDSRIEKTVGTKTYSLVSYEKDSGGEHYWTCYGLEVTDSSVKAIVIDEVNVETDADKTKAYYVITTTITGYTKDEIQSKLSYGDSTKYNVAKLEETGAKYQYKVYFDVTNASSSAGGEWIWSKLFYDGKAFDGSNGDIKTKGANGRTVTVGNKSYTIQNVDGDNNTPGNTWAIDVLVVKDLG